MALAVGLALTTIRVFWMSNELSNKVVSVIGDTMDWHTQFWVGRHGVNCGRVRLGQDPIPATNCALKAYSDGKPFRVVYNIEGWDSYVAAGLVRTPDGRLFGAVMDGDPDGGGGTSLVRQHLSKVNCPVPVQLKITRAGRLTCFHPQAAQAPSLMSPNVESY